MEEVTAHSNMRIIIWEKVMISSSRQEKHEIRIYLSTSSFSIINSFFNTFIANNFFDVFSSDSITYLINIALKNIRLQKVEERKNGKKQLSYLPEIPLTKHSQKLKITNRHTLLYHWFTNWLTWTSRRW